MKFGLLTRNVDSWCSSQLCDSMKKRGIEPVPLRFQQLSARVGFKTKASSRHLPVDELDALIVRPIGPGSLDECLFRIDLLHTLSRAGLLVVNHPSAIERCIDKYFTLAFLGESGIRVPRTVVTENVEEALAAFDELGGDVVCKPLFGSRGIGVTRLTDREVALRVFRTLAFTHHVIYIQEFIPHGTRDIRAFVIGGEVAASMYRESSSWKTNIAQGARPLAFKPSEELVELAVKAAGLMGCEVAGIDFLESREGFYLTEVNSQPGWRGLQSVAKVNIADAIIDHVAKLVKK
ncbi:MAG: RimK family alpha-L-glutamate ligase [Candidatus Nezhaarchaeota archaeon]|nr:RimK family alpha-L-glutamate ligase [Candidatus Nezhaarchaeota archaeon]